MKWQEHAARLVLGSVAIFALGYAVIVGTSAVRFFGGPVKVVVVFWAAIVAVYVAGLVVERVIP